MAGDAVDTAPVIARVLIDSPLPQLDRLFDYAIPAALADRVVVGARVRVPLRSARRIADAYVIELAGRGDYSGSLSEIDDIVSTVSVLAPEVWHLARAVADRAGGNASDIVRLAVPKRQVRVEKAWLAAQEAPESVAATGGVTAVDAPDYAPGRLAAVVDGRERVALASVPRLVRLAQDEERWVAHWAVTFAAAATQAIARGESAILVVPDHRDEDQLLAALAEVLPAESIVRLDSRQSNPERYRALLACRGDRPLAIVGNRSAVYAPARKLGLIAVWSDGDPLHAEQLAPYVHARDAALVRQDQQGCALILASHVRTTEVQRLVELGFVTPLDPERAYLPKIVPTASQDAHDRNAVAARIPSAAWKAAKEALTRGPVLVQVSRPGYAPQLACDTCHEAARCGSCGGPLATARAGAPPRCRWCGTLASTWACASCGGHRLRLVGQGSVRTAEDLGRAFPGTRVIIADGERQVLTVDSRPALVVATRGAEPVATGGYSAVLLLDGERMLVRESLRVTEDCIRWWSNAISLAAVGAPIVIVGVGGALATALATWRLNDFVASELADRRRLRFPPAVRIATVSGDGVAVERALASLAGLDGVDVLGPTDDGDGLRAIVRFDYAVGRAVASALKAEVVRTATSRRKRLPPGSGAPSPLPRLKVRFDESEPFVD